MGEGAPEIFLLLSAVIGLGFLGYLFFERTRVSDVLVLIAFGAAIGPGLHLFPADAFAQAAPFITTLALAMILFEGGLELHLTELVRGAGRGSVLALLGFAFTTAGITLVGHFYIHFDWLQSVLLGVVLGHTSSVVVFPLLNRLGLGDRSRIMLGLDSALAEVLSVVSVITISEALALNQTQIGHAAQQIASQFSVAIVLGLLVGVVWARLLGPLQKRRYNYMLTLAIVLALHVGVSSLGGNAPIAVLVFGVVLGNAETLRRAGLSAADFTPEMREFQGEITFLLRTFFFVYLGLTLQPRAILDPTFAAVSGLLLAAIVVARLLSVRLSFVGAKPERGDVMLMSSIVARGLATAVLAGLPYSTYGLDFARDFTAYALGVILLSNLVTTLGVFAAGRRARRIAIEAHAEPLTVQP